MKQQANEKFGATNHRIGSTKVATTYGFDYLYKGSLFIGANHQEMSLIIDTGSDWLVIEGVDCKSCEGNVYDPSSSSYFAEFTER